MLITRDEFCELTAVQMIDELDRNQPQTVAEAHAESLAGVPRRLSPMEWPEWVLLRMVKQHIARKQYAYSSIKTEVGEEDLNGNAYTGEGYPKMVELGYIGTASVAGKVAAEMLRRLELEQEGDREAETRRWMPPGEET